MGSKGLWQSPFHRRNSVLCCHRPRQIFNLGILLEAFRRLDSCPMLFTGRHYNMLGDRHCRSVYILRVMLRWPRDHKILVTVFQCDPVSGFWNDRIPTKCINGQSFFIGSLVPHISTDFALLLLPVPYIWRLHRTTSQKIALAGTFMHGGM